MGAGVLTPSQGQRPHGLTSMSQAVYMKPGTSKTYAIHKQKLECLLISSGYSSKAMCGSPLPREVKTLIRYPSVQKLIVLRQRQAQDYPITQHINRKKKFSQTTSPGKDALRLKSQNV